MAVDLNGRIREALASSFQRALRASIPQHSLRTCHTTDKSQIILTPLAIGNRFFGGRQPSPHHCHVSRAEFA